MKKVLSSLIIFSFLNLTVYPAFADEYMVLPPIIEEEKEQSYNNYDQPLPGLNATPDYSDTDYVNMDYTTSTNALKGTVTTVPVGTAFQVITDENLNSMRNQVGEIFKATLNQPIAVNGDIIVPAGSEVIGQVTYLQDSGRVGKNAKMEIKFTSIKPLYGPKVPIIGKVMTEDNSGILKGGSLKDQLVKSAKAEAIATVGGTAAGAGLGWMLGGVTAGAGALVGAATGAGVGLIYVIMRKGKPVKIPGGTKMVVVLEQPFNVGK